MMNGPGSYCFNCGAPLPQSARFCINCGTAQAVSGTIATAPSVSTDAGLQHLQVANPSEDAGRQERPDLKIERPTLSTSSKPKHRLNSRMIGFCLIYLFGGVAGGFLMGAATGWNAAAKYLINRALVSPADVFGYTEAHRRGFTDEQMSTRCERQDDGRACIGR